MSTRIYFLVILLLGFIAIFASSGVIKTFDVTMGDSSGKVYLNAPFILFNLISFWSYLGMLIITAIMSNAAFRDFGNNSFPLYFTKPISRFSYLSGRFLGGFVTLMFIFSGAAIGSFLACILPVYDPGQIGPFTLAAFLQPYLISVLPNVFLMGAAFFTVTILTRKMMPVYLTAVVLFVGYMLGMRLMAEMDNRFIAGLIDPLGMVASSFGAMEYWTIADKNTLLIPFEGAFLWNRIIWTTAGALILALGFYRFRFSQFLPELTRKPSEKETETPGLQHIKSARPVPLTLPEVNLDFTLFNRFKTFCRMTWNEFSWIVTNIYFIVILFTGMLFIMVNAKYVGYFYGTAGYPVTYKVLDAVGGQFIIFALIIITFFAGEMVFRERDKKSDQLFHVLPVSDGMMYFSKLLALSGIMGVLLITVMISGILIQTVKGYYNYEIGLYITELFGYTLVNYILYAIIGMMFHIIVNSKYMGHFLMVLFYISYIFLEELGIHHNLLLFGEDSGHRYSDMNGYGPFPQAYFMFKQYWFLFACLLAVFSYLIWLRGTEVSFRDRLRKARAKFTVPVQLTALAIAVIFAGTGAYIYTNTNVLNTYRSKFQEQALSVEYEKQYKQYENAAQPRVTDVRVDFDLYPYKRAFTSTGHYRMKNKTTKTIPELYITMVYEDVTIHSMVPDRPHALTMSDPDHGFYIYTLEQPLAPGEEMRLDFELSYTARGFPNSDINTDVVANGSFIHSNVYFPNIGYQEMLELSRDVTRKRHDLEPKERMAAVDDMDARMNTYISNDSDWINFETVVSTAGDQTAIAPGTLEKSWTENGRNYFHYKMDRPILHFYAFNSGRYHVKRDKWKDVNIEIFYHKGHEYNLDLMVKSIQDSLEYYSTNFSPYQHSQVRIIEFPRYSSFAQSFPNTIPYSESLGFLAKLSEDGVDYPYQITAHEMAHQWWAHQVIGGNVQGATLMSEVMAQYSSFMVLAREYDHKIIRKYLRHELDGYLRGRANESKKELPLKLVENQGYLHYNKGSIVMNALQHYIGEETLNQALAVYIDDVAYQEGPYTNSIEFIEYLRAATPEHLEYLIDDMFEKIVLYDNETVDAEYTERDDGTFEVTMTVKARKYESGELGELTDQPLNDWIEIGVLDESETPLYRELVKVDSEEMTFTMVVDALPAEAGIDPFYLLVDKKPDNNTVEVEKI